MYVPLAVVAFKTISFQLGMQCCFIDAKMAQRKCVSF